MTTDDHPLACCRRNVPPLDNTRRSGTLWACPECGGCWEWVEDEAEGGGWWPHV